MLLEQLILAHGLNHHVFALRHGAAEERVALLLDVVAQHRPRLVDRPRDNLGRAHHAHAHLAIVPQIDPSVERDVQDVVPVRHLQIVRLAFVANLDRHRIDAQERSGRPRRRARELRRTRLRNQSPGADERARARGHGSSHVYFLDKIVTWTTAFRRVHGATRTARKVRAISRVRVF